MKDLRNVDLMTGFSRKISGDSSENFILNVRKSASIIEQSLNECIKSEMKKNTHIDSLKEETLNIDYKLKKNLRELDNSFETMRIQQNNVRKLIIEEFSK